MTTTFQALGVTLIALFPGAAYTFAYERVAGAFGIQASDRLIRFLAASAIFHAGLSGLELWVYRKLLADSGLERIHPLVFMLLVLSYVGLPSLAGNLVGRGKQAGSAWATAVVGDTPEPRAWDYLWRDSDLEAVIQVKLKSGVWLAGIYGAWQGPGGSNGPMRPVTQKRATCSWQFS